MAQLSPYTMMDLQEAGAEESQLREALMKMRLMGMKGAEPVQTPLAGMAGSISTINLSPLQNAMERSRLENDAQLASKRRADIQRQYVEQDLEEQRKYSQARSADPQAYLQFEGSRSDSVRKMAEADRKAYEKLVEKGLDRSSLASIQESGGNLKKLQPKEEDIVVDGTLVRRAEGKPPVLSPGAGYTQQTSPTGEVRNVNNLTGRVSGEGGVRVTNNLGKKTSEILAEGLPKDYAKAEGMNSAIRGTETALSALGQGARAGFGEEFLQNARTLTEGLTGLKFDTTTPTAVLAKALAKNVIDELGGLGAQISNTDREFMATAIGGLNTDPTALERILAIRLGALQRQMGKYGRDLESTTGLMEPELGQVAKQRYGLERSRVGVSFKSAEAEASYIANLNNISYPEALRQVQEMRKGDVSPAGSTPSIDDLMKLYGKGKRKG